MSTGAVSRGGAEKAKSRQRAALAAAGFTNGPAALIDFLIPLWAGLALGAEAAQIGLLVAAELLVSVVARPVAGRLADTRERRILAGIGALIYGLSCCGYAFADSLAAAYAAAGLGGLGGALLWVSLRAIVSERLSADSGVFARLMSVQETGTWVAFVVGLTLLGRTDLFEPVLLACAAACLIGAAILFASPSRAEAKRAGDAAGTDGVFAGSAAEGRPGAAREMTTRAVTLRVRPMLITSATTAAAEAAVSILLLLHLQRGFGLGVIETAYVFLPGAVALAVLPPLLHKVVVRIGRRRAAIAASVASAAFAVSLAWASSPVMIAALWILSGLAWAVLMPVEQAVVAEAVPDGVGAAMGVFTAVGLLSAAAGAMAAGFLYDYVSWHAACLVSAAMILSGAVLGPWAIRSLGVDDIPTEEPSAVPPG